MTTLVQFLTLLISRQILASSILREAIDLTYDTIEGKSVTFPLHTPYKQIIKIRGDWRGIYLENNDLSQGEHAGTHMDAPAHFVKGGWRIGDIPFERLAGELVVVDITEKAAKNVDARLEIEDLEKWEEKYGRIPDNAVVVMNSGHGKYFRNTTKYLGYESEELLKKSDFDNMHFPGFDGKAAKWLVDNRNIVGVGVDTVSLDHGPALDFPAHVVFLNKNIWGLENMANVDKLKPSGMHIYAMPHYITEGSGAPTRVFAIPKPYCRASRNIPSSLAPVLSTNQMLTFISSVLVLCICK